jgi:type VI secretion system secreted protein VgrG
MDYFTRFRVFQELSIEDTIRQVLKDNSIDYRINFQFMKSDKRPVCIQYGETDLHFISRLLEENGAYFFLVSDDNKTTLHACDSSTSAQKCRTVLRLYKTYSDAAYNPTVVFNIQQSKSIGVRQVDCYSYNENLARMVSGTFSAASDSLRIGEREVFGLQFEDQEAANRKSREFLEMDNAEATILTGNSYCPEIYPGAIVEIDKVGAFFVVSVSHDITQGVKPPMIQPVTATLTEYANSFKAIPAAVLFRPPNVHKKNKIPGLVPGKVVGDPAGSVNCDEFGRILVLFPWDSRSRENGTGSCWVYVMQGWAGNGYGALFIPRVGMDVFIGFLNGDPDRPYCFGSTYCEANKPPGNYPKEMNTVSGLRTLSVDGDGFNEVRINDKGGEEEIFVHAQKSFHMVAEDDVQVTTQTGPVTVTIKKGDCTIVLHEGNMGVTLDQGGYSVTLKDGGLIFDVTGDISFKSSGDFKVECDGDMNFQAGKGIKLASDGKIEIISKSDVTVSCQNWKAEAKMEGSVKATDIKFDGTKGIEFSALQIKGNATATLEMGSPVLDLKATGMCTVSGGGRLAISAAMIQLG